MTSIERELGNLQARMELVETELRALRDDTREIRDALVSASRRLAPVHAGLHRRRKCGRDARSFSAVDTARGDLLRS